MMLAQKNHLALFKLNRQFQPTLDTMSASVLYLSLKQWNTSISQLYCTRDLTTETAVDWLLRQILRPNYPRVSRYVASFRGLGEHDICLGEHNEIQCCGFWSLLPGAGIKTKRERSLSWNLDFCHNFSLNSGMKTKTKIGLRREI